jgi:hypothetical protein
MKIYHNTRKDGSYFGLDIIRYDGQWQWLIRTGSKLEEVTLRTGEKRTLRRSTGTSLKPINPIPGITHRVGYWGLMAYLKLSGKMHMRCSGCGEGLARWKIRDPNQGDGNKYLNCCNDCIGFYDRRGHIMQIVAWKNTKAIAKRMR